MMSLSLISKGKLSIISRTTNKLMIILFSLDSLFNLLWKWFIQKINKFEYKKLVQKNDLIYRDVLIIFSLIRHISKENTQKHKLYLFSNYLSLSVSLSPYLSLSHFLKNTRTRKHTHIQCHHVKGNVKFPRDRGWPENCRLPFKRLFGIHV